MVRLVVSVVLLVLLAVFVSFNLTFTTSISVFGARFDAVPVMSVAILSFALGLVYALFLFAGHTLRRKKKHAMNERQKKLDSREADLNRPAPPPETAGEQQPAPRPARGALKRFFKSK